MDGLLGGITGLRINNFTEDFAKLEVCIEVLGRDGEEGVPLLVRGRLGCGGKWILFGVFEGNGFDRPVYFVEGCCCCGGWCGFAGGQGGGLVFFGGFSFLLFVFGFLR